MNHSEVKKMIFAQNEELKREYDSLQPLYEIKQQIIKLRIEQGLSQKELAEKVGTRQSAISRLESGGYNPSIEFLSKVANALGKEIHITIN